MHAEKARTPLGPQEGRKRGDRQCRGIRRDNAIGPACLVQHAQHLFLDLERFADGFGHHRAIGHRAYRGDRCDPTERRLGRIAFIELPHDALVEERAKPFDGSRKRLFAEILQQHTVAGQRENQRYLGPHQARADDAQLHEVCSARTSASERASRCHACA